MKGYRLAIWSKQPLLLASVPNKRLLFISFLLLLFLSEISHQCIQARCVYGHWVHDKYKLDACTPSGVWHCGVTVSWIPGQ